MTSLTKCWMKFAMNSDILLPVLSTHSHYHSYEHCSVIGLSCAMPTRKPRLLSWRQNISCLPNIQHRVRSRPSYLVRYAWQGKPSRCVPIDLSHKSHNAPITYPTMHHFVTEMCILAWCIVGFFRRIYCFRCIYCTVKLFICNFLQNTQSTLHILLVMVRYGVSFCEFRLGSVCCTCQCHTM